MITVSLTTDWGISDIYGGIFKAKLFQKVSDVQCIEVCNCEPHKFGVAAISLRCVYKYYPKNTIHLVGISIENIDDHMKNREFICFEYNQQYFVGPNNGFWSLVFDDFLQDVYKIPIPENSGYSEGFPESDIYPEVVKKLANGITPDKIGSKVECYKGMNLNKPVINTNLNNIIGSFLYFDTYGNGISNISRKDFERVGNGRLFRITTSSKECYTNILSANYEKTDEKYKIIALFNNADFLEIAIPYYPLRQYVSVDRNTKILVQFYNTEAEMSNFKLIP